MVKVLIYSSKEIYDNASYEGRAESDLVAYRRDDGFYEITKNRTGNYLYQQATRGALISELRIIENREWQQELKNHKYKDHVNSYTPNI